MISRFVDWLSEYLARRKGLLPLIGLALIVLNLIFQFVLPPGWLVSSNLLLHLGVIVAVIGLMVAWAL
jgi:hypothetical protein